VLLVQPDLDTQSMHALGLALARNGLDVEAVRLPGHGTHPEDLVGVTWDQWYMAARESLRAMRARTDRVFVCGQSLGGSLALLLAAHEPVDGVISLAGVAYMRNWRFLFLPLIEKLRPWRRSPVNDIARPGVRDVGSYNRMPFSALRRCSTWRGRCADLRVGAGARRAISGGSRRTGNAGHPRPWSRAGDQRLQRSYVISSTAISTSSWTASCASCAGGCAGMRPPPLTTGTGWRRDGRGSPFGR
jgi:pimeloyl-ACP methyl ester carboxylesterase